VFLSSFPLCIAFELLQGSRAYGLDGMFGLFDSAMKRRILLDEGMALFVSCFFFCFFFSKPPSSTGPNVLLPN
jgi:hypothetical protein